MEYGTLPTVLIYEKISQENIDNDQFDKITNEELRYLDKRAYSLQKFLDQYENAEAKLDIENQKEEPEAEKKPEVQGVVPDTLSGKNLVMGK